VAWDAAPHSRARSWLTRRGRHIRPSWMSGQTHGTARLWPVTAQGGLVLGRGSAGALAPGVPSAIGAVPVLPSLAAAVAGVLMT
jgi:hypothetical protein